MYHQDFMQKWISFLLIAIISIMLLAGCTQSSNNGIEPLSVNLLKVGKADAIIVQSGDAVMVIDTGEEDDGEELVDFLKSRGVCQIDALIITHFDKDHVGGADTLVEQMDITNIYVPAYKGTHTEYIDFLCAMEAKGLEATELNEPIEFDLADAKILVEPPLSYEPAPGELENDNNFSLITTIVHGENRLIFMGDAEKHRIRQWLDTPSAVDCDFLKVPHHGVYNTALQDLLTAVSPEYAAICSSQKNPAELKTLELLKKHGAEVFQTKDGNIIVISDGNKLELHQKRK